MISAYVRPTCLPCSQAMHRVADALARYAPSDIAIVDDVKQADVQVLHTVGAWPSLPRSYAIIQYCYCSGGTANWKKVWADSRVVWSYYDLTAHGAGNNFYYAPLGVDLNVFFPRTVGEKDLSIVTTGSAPRFMQLFWSAVIRLRSTGATAADAPATA